MIPLMQKKFNARTTLFALFICFFSSLPLLFGIPQEQEKSMPKAEGLSPRIFEGRLDKSSPVLAFFKQWPYTLVQKKKVIAYLDLSTAEKLQKMADAWVGKEICVRGIAKYINKEPYLLVVVEEIYPKN